MNEGSKNYSQADLVDHKGVAGVVKNDKGEILMQKHVKYGFWTIPVGKVDPGESIDDALKKELKEECGISVTKFKEIANKKYKYVRSGENVVVDSHIFEIQKYTAM